MRWLPTCTDGLHPDEVHRGVRVGGVQPPVRRRRGASKARNVNDAADGRRLANACEGQGRLARLLGGVSFITNHNYRLLHSSS